MVKPILQLQIEAIVKRYNSDIVHLQETDIEESTFQHCETTAF